METKTREIADMYECLFINKVAYQISDSCGGFDDTCNLLGGDECLKEMCPLMKEGSITVKWVGT